MGQQATDISDFVIDEMTGCESQGDVIAAAVDQARSQWHRDEAEHLAQAEAVWMAKAGKRLSISRIGAQRAEAAAEQMRRRLDKVEANLAARISELTQVRADFEQERVRWLQSPMAAQAQKTARDLQFRRRMKIALNLTRDFAWGVFVVALAVIGADRAIPVASGVWKHETGSQSVIRPLLRQAGMDTDHLPHAVIVIPVAKLRVRPSSAASTITSLSKGALVTLLGRRGKWILVRSGDAAERQGWVQLSALESTVP